MNLEQITDALYALHQQIAEVKQPTALIRKIQMDVFKTLNGCGIDMKTGKTRVKQVIAPKPATQIVLPAVEPEISVPQDLGIMTNSEEGKKKIDEALERKRGRKKQDEQ